MITLVPDNLIPKQEDIYRLPRNAVMPLSFIHGTESYTMNEIFDPSTDEDRLKLIMEWIFRTKNWPESTVLYDNSSTAVDILTIHRELVMQFPRFIKLVNTIACYNITNSYAWYDIRYPRLYDYTLWKSLKYKLSTESHLVTNENLVLYLLLEIQNIVRASESVYGGRLDERRPVQDNTYLEVKVLEMLSYDEYVSDIYDSLPIDMKSILDYYYGKNYNEFNGTNLQRCIKKNKLVGKLHHSTVNFL